jgi:hypothetical protein
MGTVALMNWKVTANLRSGSELVAASALAWVPLEPAIQPG